MRWRTARFRPFPFRRIAPTTIEVTTPDSAVTTQAEAPAPVVPAPVVHAPVVQAPPPATETSTRRARLLAVLAFPDTNELEVHLILDGRRTMRRAISSDGLIGAVQATLAAIREIGAPFGRARCGHARSRATATTASWWPSRSAT